MNTHIAHFDGSLRRTAFDLPQRAAAPSPKLVAWIDLLDRLAAWVERQPVHHRMGSYTLR